MAANPFGDPQAMALLGLSQGLLAAGGPQKFPVGLGGAIGQGVGGALSGAMNTVKMNQQQALVDLEQQKLSAAQAQFKLQQGLLGQFFPGLTPGQPSGTAVAGPAAVPTSPTQAGVSPGTAAAINAPWAMAPASLGMPSPTPQGATPQVTTPPQPGGFPFSPAQVAALHLAGMPDLTGALNAAQPNVDIRNGVIFDKKSGNILGTVPQTNQQGFSTITNPDKSSPTGYRVQVVPGAMDAYMAQQRGAAQAGAERDLVTVPATAPNAQPTYRSRESLIQGGANGAPPAAGMSPEAASTQAADAAQKAEVSKNYGKIYNDLQNASLTNPAKTAKFQRIGQLLDGFEGGKLSKTGLDIAKFANSAGIKVDPKLPNKEAAEALTNEVALELRSTGSGAGMPGSMSDQDREFLKSMTPQMAQTNEGRKTIIDARVKVMQRENQVAGMAREYRKKYGKLDDDFFSQLQGWSNRNPIFAQ